MDSEFPLDLQPDEERNGFELLMVRIEDSFIPGPEAERKVIGKILGPSDLLFKIRNPFTNKVCYKHRRYGSEPDDPPEWYPVGDEIFDDAGTACFHCNIGASVDPYFALTPHPMPVKRVTDRS